jgi:hypothetical protein
MIDELGRELAKVGIRGRRRKRILTEFADHLACDPEAPLGEPRQLAAQFADELASDAARRTALGTFSALVVVAFAVGLSQVTLPTVPDITSGRSMFLVGPATLAMVIGSQIAFAAGVLAAMRALRLAGPQEVALIRRRVAVAVGGGALTATGSVLYAVNFWGVVPSWWALLAVAGAGASAVSLAASALAYRSSNSIAVSPTEAARGLSADLGPFARPWLIGAVAAGTMLVATSILEGSVVEGALRGGFEAILFVGCFVALRRPLALTR